jgi:hypothetical protein
VKPEKEIEDRIKELSIIIKECNDLGNRYVKELDLKKKDFKNIDSVFYTGIEAQKEKTTLEWVLNNG